MIKRKIEDFGVRSQEVQEILNRKPPIVQRYGLFVMSIIIGFLIIGSMKFPYPDVLHGKVLIYPSPNWKFVKYPLDESIILPISKGEYIKRGDIIAYTDSLNNQDIIFLYNKFREWYKAGGKLSNLKQLLFKRKPDLGELTSLYCDFQEKVFSYSGKFGKDSEQLVEALHVLEKSMNSWLKTNVIISPIDGYFELIHPANNFRDSIEFCAIIPIAKSYYGVIELMERDVKKLKIDQELNVDIKNILNESTIIKTYIQDVNSIANSNNMFQVLLEIPEQNYRTLQNAIYNKPYIQGDFTILASERSLFEFITSAKTKIL